MKLHRNSKRSSLSQGTAAYREKQTVSKFDCDRWSNKLNSAWKSRRTQAAAVVGVFIDPVIVSNKK